MNARALLLAGAVGLLVACNQTAESTTGNAAANIAAAPVKHQSYCFFADADRKGWTASRDAQGNVTVKGKARLEDTRYMAKLVQPEVSGTSASVWLTMGPNTNATGAPDNWWDVAAAIPNSAAVTAVSVMCGTKTVAQLPVKPKA